jgi:hypothetical protein
LYCKRRLNCLYCKKRLNCFRFQSVFINIFI